MKLKLTYFVLCFLIVCLSGCQQKKDNNGIDGNEVDTKHPELQIEGGAIQHLGKFEAGQIIKKEIEIKNISDEPIVFDEKIDASCSCSSPTLSSVEVASGKSTTLIVAINIPQMSVEDAIIAIRLRLKKPMPKYVEIRLTYDAVQDWTIEPAEIILDGHAGETFVKRFFFLQRSETKVTVDSVKFNGFDFVAENPKQLNPGVFEINFSGKFPSEPKKYIGNIDVASAGKNKQIQMLCYVRPKYTVIPDKVYMYMPSEDSKYITDAVRTIRIESKQQFDIKSVKLQSAGSILSNVKWTLLEQNCEVRALGENIKYMTIQIEKVDDLTKQMTLEITIVTDGGEIPLSLPIVLIRSRDSN